MQLVWTVSNAHRTAHHALSAIKLTRPSVEDAAQIACSKILPSCVAFCVTHLSSIAGPYPVALTVLIQRTVIIRTIIVRLVQRTAKHAILTLQTQFHNVRHVMLGLFLITRWRTANCNVITQLSSIGILASAVNALLGHSWTNQVSPASNVLQDAFRANSILKLTHLNASNAIQPTTNQQFWMY